jgi:dipeptidase E
MKLLLTSSGIRNESLKRALLEMLDEDPQKTTLAFIPTAANIEEGDKGWLIDDLVHLKKVGFKSVDIVDISALSEKIYKKRLQNADVLAVGGGNTFYLMYWIRKTGLTELLPEWLETKVYVGISAGSSIMSPFVDSAFEKLYPQEPNEFNVKKGLGLVDFNILPHLNSEYFPDLNEQNIKEIASQNKEAVYAIDDESGIQVINESIEIISEGKYLKFN